MACMHVWLGVQGGHACEQTWSPGLQHVDIEAAGLHS